MDDKFIDDLAQGVVNIFWITVAASLIVGIGIGALLMWIF